MDPWDDTKDEWTEQIALLRITLSAAVPLWIERLRTTPLAELMKRAPELADVIASKGDVLQYKSKGESAHAFNALAEALAIMSFCPGGVTFAGDHWESMHPDQPRPEVDLGG